MTAEPGQSGHSAGPVRGPESPPEATSDASRKTATKTAAQGAKSRSGRGARAARAAAGLRSAGGRATAAGPLGLAVLALGIAAFGLLVAAELAPVYEVEVNGLPCEPAEPALADLCAPSGGERHSYALAVLGLLGLLMAWGAGIGGSRPAAGALAVAGAAALAIVLIGDAPDVDETGEIGLLFEQAAASPASGFWLSLAGGGVALAGGLLGLLRPRRR